MSTRPPRLLLISPAFHGYWKSIADAFTRRGYAVETLRYDAYDTALAKLRLRATVDLPARLLRTNAPTVAESARLTDRAIATLRRARPDRVVVIKGTGLDVRFWEALGTTPRVLWLYDDLDRHDYTVDFLRAIGPVADYARVEAERLADHGVDAHFVPNAFDPHRVIVPTRRSRQVVFIGSGYPLRRDILTELASRGLPIHAWGRDFSHHPYDRLRTFTWSRPPLPASREVSLDRTYEIYAEAAAAVAIHGDQQGHAMRTFEIPGMGGVQLVDRPDVDQFYEVGTEVAVWNDVDELTELSHRALSDSRWSAGLRRRGRQRTLAEHTFDHRIAEVDSLWV